MKNQVTIYCGDFVGLDLNSVHGQENNGFRGASSFVAVEKRVVLNDVEEIRRRHLDQVSVEKLTSERCLRHRDSGVQQADVSDTLHTPIMFDQTAMRSQRTFDVQEQWQHGRLRFGFGLGDQLAPFRDLGGFGNKQVQPQVAVKLHHMVEGVLE